MGRGSRTTEIVSQRDALLIYPWFATPIRAPSRTQGVPLSQDFEGFGGARLPNNRNRFAEGRTSNLPLVCDTDSCAEPDPGRAIVTGFRIALHAFWAECTQQALEDEDENEMPIGVADQGPRLGAPIGLRSRSTRIHATP